MSYLVPFLRYSASNNGVTLKSWLWSFNVIIKIAPFDRSYATYYWPAISSILYCQVMTTPLFDVSEAVRGTDKVTMKYRVGLRTLCSEKNTHFCFLA